MTKNTVIVGTMALLVATTACQTPTAPQPARPGAPQRPASLHGIKDSQRPEAVSARRAESPDDQLIAAASTGDLGRVRELLKGAANVNARTSVQLYMQLSADGKNVVAYFPPERRIEMDGRADEPYGPGERLRIVVEPPKDAQLIPFGGGETPLMRAASGGHLEVVKVLIENEADINAQDDADSTALIDATIAGHVPVVNLLLQKGAKTDVRTKAGKTALEYAEEAGKRGVVETLRQHMPK